MKKPQVAKKHTAAVEPIAPLALGMSGAARATNLSRAGWYSLLASGEGPRTFHIGKRHMVRVAELQRWLAEREKFDNQ